MDAFKNRVRKNQRHFGKWARRRNIGAYRIYDHDIPEVPAVIERFGDKAVLWHVPRFDDDLMMIDEVNRAVLETLELPETHLYVKHRAKQSGSEQYEKLDGQEAELVVKEGGLKYLVNCSDYLDTGLFLDQRNNREMIRQMSEGKSVLNLFSYTGSFSLCAAAGGADRTTTVDLSNTYLQWAERNFELNYLKDEKHDFVQADVFGFLREAWGEDRRFDLIICDPPTFSNSKRMIGTLDVQRDHPGLVNLSTRLLKTGGKLFFSTNRRKFQLDEEALDGVVDKELSPRCIPEDFRDKKVHRAWWIKKQQAAPAAG